MRTYELNRWNWSERAKKWVYVELSKGTKKKRKYRYQVDPPQEFIDLTLQLHQLNEKLITIKDPEKNKQLYLKMMEITKRMQKMRNL